MPIQTLKLDANPADAPKSGARPAVSAIAIAAAALGATALTTHAGEPAWDTAIGDPGIETTDPSIGVRAMVEYQGDLIAAGGITQAGDVPADFVARWDGQEWSPMGDGFWSAVNCPPGNSFPNGILALEVWNNKLIAAGHFTHSGDQVVNGIAWWDEQASAWQPFGGSDELPDNGGCAPGLWATEAMTVFNGDLIAGGRGDFDTPDGQNINRLARWDGQHWHQVGEGDFFRPEPGDGLVLALEVFDGDLIVGGDFEEVDGVDDTNWIARWDGDQWFPMSTGFHSNALVGFKAVLAFGVVNEALFAGLGAVAITEGGTVVAHLARWDGSSWSQLPGGNAGGTTGRIFSIAEFNNQLVVGGNFGRAGAFPNPGTSNIARHDGEVWLPVGGGTGTAFPAPVNGTNSASVDALTVFDGNLVIGGKFSSVGGDDTDYSVSPALRIATYTAGASANPADLNGDGVVDGADLGLLLGQWGTDGPADLNNDDVVDGADLGLLLGQWG